jgi:hypothetical protein
MNLFPSRPARATLRAGLLLLTLAAALPLRAQTGKDQLTIALSAPTKPGTLHVKLVSGSINVVGYSGKEVVIEAAAGTGGRKRNDEPSAPGGMRRVSTGNGFDISAQEENNHVHVRTDSWRAPVNLVIKVPQRFSLQISTVQNGDVVVENVSGELEVNNVNGGIQLNQVSGSAVATTVNGPITASFREVSAGTPMAFSTVNGKVDLTLPPKTKASLKLKSDRGEIYSDFDLVTERKETRASSSGNGMYRLSVDDWTYGKLNGGGAEIMLKSLQGNLYIRKAK